MKCDENLRGRVQKNRNIGAGSGSGSQKMEIPGPDSEKISGLISGPGTRNKPSIYTRLKRNFENLKIFNIFYYRI